MLDITTLMAVLALTTVTSVFGLLVASVLNRQVVAIRYWALGLSVIVCGVALQSVRAYFPLWVSAVVITQGYFVLLWGTRCYRLSRSSRGFVPAMVIITLLQGLVFFALQASLRFSIMAHSAIVVLVAVLMIVELWRMQIPQRALVWVWSGIWCMHALLYLRRFLLYQFDPAYINASTFEAAEKVEALNYLEGIVFLYGFSLLCVILATRSLQEELKLQATRDPLTNLLNRRAFEEAALRQLAISRRAGESVALLLLDLDKFKAINDAHGHSVGDEVLTVFAAHLTAQLRAQDLLCRFGGEEFVLLVPGADSAKTEALAERIRSRWQKHTFKTLHGELATTVSIGYVCVNDGAEQGLYRLIERADQALYEAKQQGRNCARSWQVERILTTAGV
ncbi:GGDEF domain-containing protein [Halopseudomonas sabulinigri]|uniref:diguanylate cyclase n=1 Tax=Halopseudomonas sabulinigri TaxID=472181 RepID=A0ABP9ZK69_9GAMM